jgi:glutathionylspermidine synthase
MEVAVRTSVEMSLSEYRRLREEFFGRHGHRWPGTLEDAFDILAAYPMNREECDAIRKATAGLTAIYKKAAVLFRRLPDQVLVDLGVPSYLFGAVRRGIPGMSDCVVGRFDLVRTKDGYRMLEFNSDAPGLIVEAFSVNEEVCRAEDKSDPNAGCEAALACALTQAVRAGLDYVGRSTKNDINIVVTFGERYSRDRAAAVYLSELLHEFAAECAPIETLGLDVHGLYDPGGKPIDVLYRFTPLKFIRNELFRPHGEVLHPEMGGLLLHLIESRRLAMINPPFAFLLESKAIQAVIWNLFEAGQYFDDRDCRLIETYMLPTYLDPPSGQYAYVIKPVMGAEGDTITLMDQGKKIVSEARYTTYSDQPMVYQKYVALPQEQLMTEYGPRTLHLATSCFVTSGIPAAICIRAGEAITDETAWVLPVSAVA